MRLPSQKKISREDLKDAPDWVNNLIDPLNNFMQTVYQAMNKNINEDNTSSQIKEITYKTPSTYPVMDPVEFQSTLKTKAVGCTIMQCIEKGTYNPVETKNPAWVDDNGVIRIFTITGLQADKTYIVRVRLT